VKLLAGVAISDPISAERVATCRQFVTELEALDQALVDIRGRTVTAVDASKTTIIDVYGVGPIGAASILGHSGDIRRFPTAGLSARVWELHTTAAAAPRRRPRAHRPAVSPWRGPG
jgi:transposase